MFSDTLAKFEGTWKQIEVNGLSEFLEAQGVSWMERKLAVKCSPVDTIKVAGDNLTISYTGMSKKHCTPCVLHIDQ